MTREWILSNFILAPGTPEGVAVKPGQDVEFEPWEKISAKRRVWHVKLQGGRGRLCMD